MSCLIGVGFSSPANAAKCEQVYLFRGGFGGAYSAGMDQIAETLRARGVKAESLSFSEAQKVGRRIAAAKAQNKRSGPVILVGHSLGGNAVIRVAEILKRKDQKVDYVAVFDGNSPNIVPSNVERVKHFTATVRDRFNNDYRPAPGFRGSVKTINVQQDYKLTSVTHYTITEVPRLQEEVVSDILRTVRRAKGGC